MFQFQIDLTDKDYLCFNRHHLYHSKPGRSFRTKMKVIVPVIFALFLLLFWILELPASFIWTEAVLLAILTVLWFCFFRKFMQMLLKKQVKNMKKAGRLPYQRQTTLVFDEEEIVETSDQSEFRNQYDAIEKVCNGSCGLYLYLNAVQAFLIPDRAFAGPEEKQALLEFLRRKCPGAVFES